MLNKTTIMILLSIVILLLNGCASTPKTDPRIAPVQQAYDDLLGNHDLAVRGGEELKHAKAAMRRVNNRDKSIRDREYNYTLYAADRLIQIAEFSARARLASDQRKELVHEQEKMILAARIRETQRARQLAAEARTRADEATLMRKLALEETAQAQKLRDLAQQEGQAAEAKRLLAEHAQKLAEEKRLIAEGAAQTALGEAEQARQFAQVESARAAAESQKAREAMAAVKAAQAEMESMRNKLSALQAKQTERGLLITLGDVLFEFNKSELKGGAARNLLPLVEVLKERSKQTVIIEGHTDSIGSKTYNLQLSEKRANAVRNYLVSKGVTAKLITTAGLGPDFPVADNSSESGRQQNRRVEVILPNLE